MTQSSQYPVAVTVAVRTPSDVKKSDDTLGCSTQIFNCYLKLYAVIAVTGSLRPQLSKPHRKYSHHRFDKFPTLLLHIG